jgi:hypothetical protein
MLEKLWLDLFPLRQNIIIIILLLQSQKLILIEFSSILHTNLKFNKIHFDAKIIPRNDFLNFRRIGELNCR